VHIVEHIQNYRIVFVGAWSRGSRLILNARGFRFGETGLPKVVQRSPFLVTLRSGRSSIFILHVGNGIVEDLSAVFYHFLARRYFGSALLDAAFGQHSLYHCMNGSLFDSRLQNCVSPMTRKTRFKVMDTARTILRNSFDFDCPSNVV